MQVTPGNHASSCGLDHTDSSGCNETVTLPNGGKFEVYDNAPLAGSDQITHAVVVVHGTSRNADGYYEHMMGAAHAAKVTDHTIVVAPHFQVSGDKPKGTIAWKENDDWKQGAESAGLSSFEVMDDLVGTLANRHRFPNLTSITIAGHSAGAQFTQRYAVFGKAPNQLPWVQFNYLVANPSSFVYLDSWRPSPTSRCDFNAYKYGLDGREGYVAELSAEQALAQFAGRRVTIANGGDDTYDNGDLDTSCEGNTQGPNRSARGKTFFDHIKSLVPAAPFDYVVVPGVDHDATEMFASPLTWPALFGVIAP